MRIPDLRKIAKEMTDGPWFSDEQSYFVHADAFSEREIVSAQFTADAAGIAAIRNHIAALIDALELASMAIATHGDHRLQHERLVAYRSATGGDRVTEPVVFR